MIIVEMWFRQKGKKAKENDLITQRPMIIAEMWFRQKEKKAKENDLIVKRKERFFKEKNYEK